MGWHMTGSVEEFQRTVPTSNALYQRLGYRPVEDRTVVLFQP